MSYKYKVKSGLRWNTFSRLSITGMQLLQLYILSYLLSPDIFGALAIIMTIIGFGSIVADAGFSKSIIVGIRIDRYQLSLMYLINIIFGVSLCFFTYYTSNVIAYFYNSKELDQAIKILSISFVIISISAQEKVLLEKEMRFSMLALIEFNANLFGTILTIVLSYKGIGLNSIVFGFIFIQLIISASIICMRYRVMVMPRFGSLKTIAWNIKFGIMQITERTLNYLTVQIDVLIIGKFFGMDLLGGYNIAKTMSSRPVQLIVPIFSRVLLPYLSKIKENEFLVEQEFLKFSGYLAVVSTLIFGYLSFFSEAVFYIILEESWLVYNKVFAILCISVIFVCHGTIANFINLSHGVAGRGLKWNIFSLIIFSITILISAQYSILAVAMSIVITRMFLLVFSWYYLIKFKTSISFCAYILTLTASLGPLMIVYILAIKFEFREFVNTDYLTFIIRSVVFYLVLIPLLWFFYWLQSKSLYFKDEIV